MSFECGKSDTEENERVKKASILTQRTQESHKAAGSGREDLQMLSLTPATRGLSVDLGEIHL